MSKVFTACLILFASLQFAQAEDNITYIVGLSYQDKNLNFSQRYSGAASNEADFSVHMPMLNASLTAVYKKVFVKIKAERSMADISANTTETDRSVLFESNLITLEGSEIDVERTDNSFTVGYVPWRSLSVFTGYLEGETKLTPDAFCANPFSEVPCSRTNRAFQQFVLGDEGIVDNQPSYTQVYSESGYYLGLSYNFKIGELGSLSTSFAMAQMDGEYRDNANDPTNGFADPVSGAPTFVAFHYKGDTTGTSLSLTWTGSLGDSSAYFLNVRRQSYSMDGQDVTGLVNFEGVTLKTDEEILGVSLGVRLYY
ncbi:MAG: hypothetical protein ACI93R_002467 [Flavobacteriales bacterium]|jgi:hypothetical protein